MNIEIKVKSNGNDSPLVYSLEYTIKETVIRGLREYHIVIADTKGLPVVNTWAKDIKQLQINYKNILRKELAKDLRDAVITFE